MYRMTSRSCLKRFSSERVVLFEVMTEILDQADWTARRRSLEKRFRQERIVIRYMSIGVV